MTAGPDTPGSFFGRRKGKALRPGQDRLLRELLPKLRIELDGDGHPLGSRLEEQFRMPIRAVRLEIGFGGGEHLLARARAHPEIGFIGCEPFVNGMAKLLAAIEAEGIGNIRVWDQDATWLLSALPAGCLERIYLLYPDPWPKRRQRKRRFVSDRSLGLFARVLRPGGELRFATDIDDYAGWVLTRIARSADFRWDATRPADWREPWPGWSSTRYEAKARREGRPAAYLTFPRV